MTVYVDRSGTCRAENCRPLPVLRADFPRLWAAVNVVPFLSVPDSRRLHGEWNAGIAAGLSTVNLWAILAIGIGYNANDPVRPWPRIVVRHADRSVSLSLCGLFVQVAGGRP